ncbi:CHANNEL AKT6 putative-RELATED [Salix viminalis]|uniref:CHANNEL AKT6 putative-RELATED n=1 Tax=Salix viminalis TaxID=40686 RepID=A0A9Q0ZQW8_SALVM|nr:CHANNEL AKT6 putative-RELATED [Salix viminalis]
MLISQISMDGHQGLWLIIRAKRKFKLCLKIGSRKIRKQLPTTPKHLSVPYGGKSIAKYNSEPTIPPFSPSLHHDGAPSRRRRADNFQNSLVGMMSVASTGENGMISSPARFTGFPSSNYPARVTLSCPNKGEVAGKLVVLPKSFQELLDIGARKYGCIPTKILTKEGAEIEDIELVRDGDHLVLVPGSENKI